MKLSVIIPCYNEVRTINRIIDAVKKSSVINQEIIVVDDGSDDGTTQILKNISDPELNILFHTKNRGKGAAIRTGISEATGDICIIQDADLEYDPQEYSLMIEPIISGKADVVFGSRFKSSRPHRVVYFWHSVGNGFLTLLSNIFTDLNLSDMETCYKAFRSEIIKSIIIRENRFGFEPEITAKLSKMNVRIYETGISYYGRRYDEGKKIGWKDGVWAVYCIFRYNLFN
ncbi:glycosyltransferase family 2 protein [Prochlorococcus marinus]|uniref:glycosyltransferase family 2 protein n=1 Tax=Prochlorococcus marinus TaxID=1219 RepID=UPI0022B4B638|nr:glycosyltransferase family 2 protein [Prochlorococcus marinus]